MILKIKDTKKERVVTNAKGKILARQIQESKTTAVYSYTVLGYFWMIAMKLGIVKNISIKFGDIFYGDSSSTVISYLLAMIIGEDKVFSYKNKTALNIAVNKARKNTRLKKSLTREIDLLKRELELLKEEIEIEEITSREYNSLDVIKALLGEDKKENHNQEFQEKAFGDFVPTVLKKEKGLSMDSYFSSNNKESSLTSIKA